MIIFQDLEPGPEAPTGLLASIELDATAATTSVIPQGGGSLSAFGSDGTVYTLEIPPTALVTGVEITMTPIATVSTPDETGSAVTWKGALGVRLEPEGLHLFDAASLRIEPSADIDTASWRGASASGGVDAHPYPLLDAELLTLPIVHFSEFIVTDGIYLPVEVPSSIPVGAQAQLMRDIVAWQKDDGRTPEDARAIRDKYWPYVEAILGRSATDCAFAEGGQITRAGGLVRMMSIFNIGAEGDVAAFQAGVLVALENCIREVTEERCFDRNSRHHLTRLIGLVRQAQLLGASDKEYEILSKALTGEALPGAALCGDVYGTLVVSTWSGSTLNGQTHRSRDTTIIDVSMTGGRAYAVDAGSSFSSSGSWSTTGRSQSGRDCYQGRGSSFGAGSLWPEGSDGPPRLREEVDGSYDLYLPLGSITSRSIVQAECDYYPLVTEDRRQGDDANCGPHGELLGRLDGDNIDFSRSFSNPEGTGHCSVSGKLTVPG